MARHTVLTPHMQCLLPVLLWFVVGASKAQMAPVYIPGSADGLEPVAPLAVEATPVLMARSIPSSTPEAAVVRPSSGGDLLTKTVYGFLDFTTTVAGTVMVFTPQSAADEPTTTSRPGLSPRKSPTIEPRVKPNPTPTLRKSSFTTKPPNPQQNPRPHITSSLESSFFDPATTLALEDLFSATPRVPEPQPQSKVQTATPKSKTPPQARRPFAFRHRNKDGESSTESRRRLDLNFFLTRKKTNTERRRTGGSTIVPITVEGTGTLSALPTRNTPAPPPSQPKLSTPSEVVISATQGFASLSVIGPFNTAINNELGQVNQKYDYLSSESPLQASSTFNLLNVDAKTESSFPTGMVTKMGGTIVADGHTTVHETSVIGTYIDGKYAQVLRSTSHIFQNTLTQPVIVLATPTVSPEYETVRSVIKGSATQFITPQATSSLPLESLFSDEPSGNRNSRTTENGKSSIQDRLRSALSKRRGAHDSTFEEPPEEHDPFIDEEEDHDLQRSGSRHRPSFKLFRPSPNRKTTNFRTSVRRAQEVSTIYAQTEEPQAARTFRPRFKPTATRRFASSRPTRLRSSPPPPPKRPSRPPPPPKRPTRPPVRSRPRASPRPKPSEIQRPVFPNPDYERPKPAQERQEYPPVREEPTEPTEETVGQVTTTIANEDYDVVVELATVRSLHTFRVGTTRNTRFVTYTKTFTLDILQTAPPEVEGPTTATIDDGLYETPLFENILESNTRDVSTLPPVDLGASDIRALLETVTETFSTTEVMEKTSVLPVLQNGGTTFHTLTQTYYITRVVTAYKTMPPVQAFSFIPENSLNEFNGQLLAEGSENDEALLPGELEYDANGELVGEDPTLAELAGGEFNPDAMEQQLHPELTAAMQQRQEQQKEQATQQTTAGGGVPQLLSGLLSPPASQSMATPSLTTQQIQQLAYLRLLSPYGFGSFQQFQAPRTTVTSTPVVITTDITTTSTRVFRVIFNARPIMTTISSVEVVHTTLTTLKTSTVTVSPSLPGLSFPFQLG